MKKITLLYDKSNVELVIPEKNLTYYIDSKNNIESAGNLENLENAVASSPEIMLDRFVKNKRVGVILADYTRKICFPEIIQVLFKRLNDAASIKVFIATGTHKSEYAGNYHIMNLIKNYCDQFHLPLEKVIIHDCHSDSFYCAGISANNNKIYVNSESKDIEVFVTYSDMKNHYFAGYSNALKNFCPGICKYETIERNHSLALQDMSTFGHHPLHPLAERRNNPLAFDIWEGYQLIVNKRPVYLLATIMKQNQIIWSEAGFLESVTKNGIEQVDNNLSVRVKPSDHMIVSCGGYPNDESLYIAQRALELSKNGVKKGGDILFIAACSNGIGSEKAIQNFFIPLQDNVDEVIKKYRDYYIMFSHKSYKFAQLIKRMRNVFVYSTLSSEQVKSIHLTPVTSIQHIIDSWIKTNPEVRINIFPEGNKFAVHAKDI